MVVLLSLLAGCQSIPPQEIKKEPSFPEREVTAQTSLEAVSWSEVPAALWQDRDTKAWAEALERSALYYRRLPSEQIVHFGSSSVSVGAMARACNELAGVARLGDGERLRTVLQQRYRLFRSVGNQQGDVLVTAYYEPLLHGSFRRSDRYFYPIYRRPPDLLESAAGADGHRKIYRLERGQPVPYYDRSQIDGTLLSIDKPGKPGKLAKRGLELVWVDSPIDAFFLHIQGSGRVVMENGRMLRLGYDSANGHSYLAIGKILIDEGQIPKEEMTMPRLRQWLLDHPAENERLFFANPSYVFFRELQGDPVGNINISLTPERSIATDHRLFPKGAPAILATTAPLFAGDGKTVTGWRPDIRWVVNQDTGGAIRGAGRVDLFVGFGDNVEHRAGVMKQTHSQLYFIAPLSDAP
ncbi:MAG: murein transglycosylase A [Magnetococcales bacterium]|nr:murein transglycosylase A [Magnetococcales bacterium]